MVALLAAREAVGERPNELRGDLALVEQLLLAEPVSPVHRPPPGELILAERLFYITPWPHSTKFRQPNYILSRYLSGKRFSEAVRGHWGIESMHWVLDVNFREDDSRTRERTLGNNLSWLRRFAVTLLKRHPIKDSLRGKMLRCMMNAAFVAEVLTLQ